MSLTAFKQYLEDKTVAIVGPATTLHESKLGSKIDTYDITCRLNHHFAEPSKMVNDYGSRNDVVFSGPNLLYCHYEILDKIHPKFICFPRANAGDPNYYRGMISQIKCDHPEIQCFHLGDEFANSVEAQMQTPPNTGILAISYLTTMPIKELFVCGFDFYQNRKKYFKEEKSFNGKFDEQIEKYGFIKYESEHDQEKHIQYFLEILGDNQNMLQIDKYMKNILEYYGNK